MTSEACGHQVTTQLVDATTMLGPHGNASITYDIFHRLKIRPLQNQTAVRGQMGSAAVNGDGTTLWHHRWEAP